MHLNFWPKWQEVLMVMPSKSTERRLSLTEISVLADITFSHLHKLVRGLEMQGFIEITREARSAYPVLTDKGEYFASQLKELRNETIALPVPDTGMAADTDTTGEK